MRGVENRGTVDVAADERGAEVDDRGGGGGEEGVVEELPRGGALLQRGEAALQQREERAVDRLDPQQSRGGLVLGDTAATDSRREWRI